MKQAWNHYLPSWEYVPDGEPHIFGERLYGSHDRFNGTTYCMEPYVCWSAPVDDLSDWIYHGVIYTGEDDALAGYKYFDLCGRKSIAVKVKARETGTLAVRTSADGPDIAEISISACHDWTEYAAAADVEDGTKALYFVYHGKGTLLFKSFTLK